MSKEFAKKTIGPEVEKIAQELNCNTGHAFQRWLMDLFCKYNVDIEEDESYVLLSVDGGVDLLLVAPNQQNMYVIQAKFIGKNSTVDWKDILQFSKLRDMVRSPKWIEKTKLSGNARDAMEIYRENMENGWVSTWHFITNGRVPENVESERSSLDCEVQGPSELSAMYKEANSQVASIPDKVSFAVAGNMILEFHDPRKTLIAVIRGTELKNLYSQHSEKLLAYNIRRFMGDKGINKDIIKTAQDAQENFFYFNNGISAICNDFTRIENKVTAEKFQIINGGQTIGSLHKASKPTDVKILLKLMQGTGKSSDSGFNHEVIRFNNTQNKIESSDFRSNDPIQRDIAQKFKKIKPGGTSLSKPIEYRHKRGGPRLASGHDALKLEDLAKIIYAYKHIPCTSVESPKSLWEDDTKYEVVFGKQDDLWSDEDFNEAVLAVSFYFHIKAKIKERKKNAIEESKKDSSADPNKNDYLMRVRYLILGLARVYVAHKKISSSVWKNEKKFAEIFKWFWKEQHTHIRVLKREADDLKATRGSINNLVRSEARWKQLKEDFEESLKDSE